VWSIRSLDQGRTWTDLCQIQSGYCGAIRDMIETDAGDLVVPAMRYLPDGARHATVPYISTDQGLTWKETGLLDIGGRGHHDGSIEPTLVQLRDRRLWMLLRTNLDQLWQSYSSDGGRSWGELTPTAIDASSSPAIVKRLASGRLVLAWNRLYPQGKSQSPRRAGQYSQKPASWQREELSIAFSENDGKTWTRPAVIARNPGKRLSYPWIFERRPGVLWITTMQGGLKLELKEEDWCGR
jgi:predicted neuraminidase